MNESTMKFEDEAKIIIDAVTKSATSQPARALARGVRDRLTKGVKTLGLFVFDEVSQRLSQEQNEIEDPVVRRPKVVSAREAAEMFARNNSKPEETIEPDAKEDTGDEEKIETQANPKIPARESKTPATTKKYGINRVVLLVRHPDRGFAYWEIAADRIPHQATGRLELQDAESNAVLHSVEVDPKQGRNYFDLPDPNKSYCAELFIKNEQGDWDSLSSSYPAKYDPENPTGSQPPSKNPG
jgi:hypothetical protein